MMLKDLYNMLYEEQLGGNFAKHIDLEEYVKKISEKAEILSHFQNGFSGFIAYYCNDYHSKHAYVSMVFIRPESRGKGIAKFLLRSALSIMRDRGFTRCSLEVEKHNIAAFNIYVSLGFRKLREVGGKLTLELCL